MGKLVSDYAFVVIDNEAGLEHFSRKTTRACQELVVVSDGSQVGLRSAQRIFALVEELGITAKKKFLVVNRATEKDTQGIFKKKFAADGIFYLPYDKEVLELSTQGLSLEKLSKSSSVWAGLKELGEAICQKN